jgi:hypothetical protein
MVEEPAFKAQGIDRPALVAAAGPVCLVKVFYREQVICHGTRPSLHDDGPALQIGMAHRTACFGGQGRP